MHATARLSALGFVFLALASCATRPDTNLARVEAIVVIYAENRSFDHLYGLFAGAEGIAQASAVEKTQLDHDGKPLPSLPATYDGGKPRADLATQGLANGPFRIDAPPLNRRWDELLPSPIHNYYQNREQINGGANNKFVALTTAGAWTMGYFDGSGLRLGDEALAMGARIHARRSFLHGRVRRLVPQPHVARLRVHAALGSGAGVAARAARRAGQPAQAAEFAAVGDGRPGAAVRRRGEPGWLHRQHDAAALSAERRGARA